MSNKSLAIFGGVLLVALLTFGIWQNQRNAAEQRRYEAFVNLRQLTLAILEHEAWHRDMPDSLDQLEQYFESPETFRRIMTNPLTGDYPGYEYIDPGPRRSLVGRSGDTVIMYQLREGQRDLTLPVGFADGSIRPIGEPSL